MRLVVLESPYAGSIDRNVAYALACLRDCIRRGEAPAASHILLARSGALDDAEPAERAHGIAAGHAWIPVADAVVVYTDRGISGGMRQGIEAAERAGVPVEYRLLEGWGR